jgi:hypothetical protein
MTKEELINALLHNLFASDWKMIYNLAGNGLRFKDIEE